MGWGENDRKTKEFKLGLQAFRPDESGSYIGACYERHCSWMGWRDFGRTIPLRRIGLSAMYTRFPLLWHRCAGEARDGGASNRRTRAKSGERRWTKGEIENETLIVLDGMDTLILDWRRREKQKPQQQQNGRQHPSNSRCFVRITHLWFWCFPRHNVNQTVFLWEEEKKKRERRKKRKEKRDEKHRCPGQIDASVEYCVWLRISSYQC